MWDVVTAVQATYNLVLFERHASYSLVILNAGLGIVQARSWRGSLTYTQPAPVQVELRTGDQVTVDGTLIRLHPRSGDFAAVALANCRAQ
jgi:hypothetical protein